MFKHSFHAGPAVEVLSTTGKNPLEKWKSTGTVNKAFDSQMKGYVFTIDGQSKISVPKEEKETLGLIQPFLVFQIFIPLGKNLHIEVGITDSTKTRRRLIFHSGAKEIVANPLHARIPITLFRRNQWVNLSLDVSTFTRHCFKSVQYRSIDFLEITASCKLRRIFTMKNPLFDDQQEEDIELAQMVNQMMSEELRENMPFEYIPSNLGFPQGFTHFNQLIFPHRIKGVTGIGSTVDENINQTNNNAQQKVQLAFGQRIAAGGSTTTGSKSSGFNSKISANSNSNFSQADNKGLMIVGGQSKNQERKSSSSIAVPVNRKNSKQTLNQKPGTNQNTIQNQNQDILEEDEELKEEDNEFHSYSNNYDDEYVDKVGGDEDQNEAGDPVSYSGRRKNSQSKSPIRKTTREDLKDQEHYLYLQNQSDEEDPDQQQSSNTQTVSKQIQINGTSLKKTSNPWDISGGRQAHDNKTNTSYNNTVDQSSKQLQQNSQNKANQPRTQQQFNSRANQQQQQQSTQIQNTTISSSQNKKQIGQQQDKSPVDQGKSSQQRSILKRDRSSNKKVSFIEENKKTQDEDASQNNLSDFKNLKQQIASQSSSNNIDEIRKKMIMQQEDEEDQIQQAEKIRKLNPYEYTRDLIEEMKNSNSPKNTQNDKNTTNKYGQIQKNKATVMPNRQKLKKEEKDLYVRDDEQYEDQQQQIFNGMAKGSKYNNFNLESWGMADNDTDDFKNHKIGGGVGNNNIDESIEEAFDANHENLMNYFNNNNFANDQAKSSDLIQSRKSKEYKENPLNKIDFDLNNDLPHEDNNANLTTDHDDDNNSRYESRQNTQDTTRMYQKLESSRKEERRPFSPPFKLPINSATQNNQMQSNLDNGNGYLAQNVLFKQGSQLSDGLNLNKLSLNKHQSDGSDLVKIGSKTYDNDDSNQNDNNSNFTQNINSNLEFQQQNIQPSNESDFDKQLEYLKVQRADVLRDSLDQTIPKASNRDSQKEIPSRATVQNENGDLLEVIFDPILQCFYDPKTNNYYELKYK